MSRPVATPMVVAIPAVVATPTVGWATA